MADANRSEVESTDTRRQFVNFAFYQVDPAWRRLTADARERGKCQFIDVVKTYEPDMLILPYSLVGIRGDCDLMLWRIGYDLQHFQGMTARLLSTDLGRYLTTPYSYLAMTKRSTYVRDHRHPDQEGTRLRLTPGKFRYLFVYPFVKTRAWYRLTQAARQGMMNEHIAIGHKFPTVRLNTTYSFGLDDQEFVVAFETDKPQDFLDLVMELRQAETSNYTLKDTPIFTCIHGELREVLDLLGG